MLLTKILSPPSLFLLPLLPSLHPFLSLQPFPKNPALNPHILINDSSVLWELTMSESPLLGTLHAAVYIILTTTLYKRYDVITIPIFQRQKQFKGGQVIICGTKSNCLENLFS